MVELREAGYGMAIVDAVRNEDLMAMGIAFAQLSLLSCGLWGGDWVASKLQTGANVGRRSIAQSQGLSGHCVGQLFCGNQQASGAFHRTGWQAFALDPLALSKDASYVETLLASVAPHLPHGPVLIYATASAEHVQAVQAQLGAGHAGEMVEAALSTIARRLVSSGG